MPSNCHYCGKPKAEIVNTEIEEETVVELTYHCSSCNRDFTDRYEYEDTVDENDEVINL